MPVDAADMLMTFGAISAQCNDADTVTTPLEGIIAAADPDGQPIVVGPDGAEITSADAEAYAAAFDPETGALARGLSPTRSPPAWRSTRRARRGRT